MFSNLQSSNLIEMFEIIININMQRKKSEVADYKLASSPQNYNQLFNRDTINRSHIQQNHQHFFMKYASSIIQVVNQDKLQKSNQYSAQGEQKSPIYDISEVKSYGLEMLNKNSQHKTVQSSNYNNLGQGFKKKSNKKQILVYNFTNITLFLSHIAKVQVNLIKNVFSTLKNTPNKTKSIKSQPPKSKSSFHSDYTASTANQDNGIKKLSNFYHQLKKNQKAKESINIIKGWIQFRILIIKSQSFRSIKSFFNSKVNEKKQITMKESIDFPLTSLANQESLFLINQDQLSLVYTADQNFQFSQKEITITTPQQCFSGQKYYNLTLNKQSKGRISQYATPNNHQSLVEVYKLSQFQPLSFQQKIETKLSYAHPISLSFHNQTKYLILSTNTFQLPLISQFYLKDGPIPIQNQAPLKKDSFLKSQKQAQFSSDQIINQFQLCKTLIFKESLKKSKLKAKINTSQENSSKLNIQCVKNVKAAQLNTHKSAEKLQIKNDNKQKKGLHKVEDYYFPGVQSRIDKLVQTRSRIQIIGDKKNTVQTHKINSHSNPQQFSSPASKNIRIQESVVRNFPFQSQIKVIKGSDTQRDQMIGSKQKKISFNLPTQQRVQHKLRPKISVGFNSPQQKTATSPQNLTLNISGNNQIKRNPYFSPPSTLRHFESPQETRRNHIVSKPIIQQQYNQMRPSEQQIRHSNKDRQVNNVQNNIYQFNSPNQQPKAVPNNLVNYYHKIDNTNTNLKAVKEIHQPQNYKISQKSLSYRPCSKIASSPNHMNNPFKAEHLPYGIPTSRQTSQRKVFFHSPQTNRNNHPQTGFNQDPEPQQVFTAIRQDYNHQYFIRQNLANKPKEKSINFNNKYYTSGATIPSRPNQMIPYPETKHHQKFNNQRPHSSFRQSTERFNIFSNYSPLNSQIQNTIQRSNNFSSRNSSQIKRPKSMDQKIHVTIRRER